MNAGNEMNEILYGFLIDLNELIQFFTYIKQSHFFSMRLCVGDTLSFSTLNAFSDAKIATKSIGKKD